MTDTSDSWMGEKIILNETQQLDNLLKEGYEIIDRDFNLRAEKNDNGELETFIKSRLLLQKESSLLNVDVNSLGLYSMQFAWLYDFEKNDLYVHS